MPATEREVNYTITLTLADLFAIADAACELDIMQVYYVDQPDEQAIIRRRVEQLHNILERAAGEHAERIYAMADGA